MRYRYPITAAVKIKTEILQTPKNRLLYYNKNDLQQKPNKGCNKGCYTTTKMKYYRSPIKAATLLQK
jgi:hypothetical protein